jgi:hypothetical protein
MSNACEVLMENLKEREHLDDLDVRIILKRLLKEIRIEEVEWSTLSRITVSCYWRTIVYMLMNASSINSGKLLD